MEEETFTKTKNMMTKSKKELKEMGWNVIIWECQLKKTNRNRHLKNYMIR